MGVETGLWRARIGLFVQPRKCLSRAKTLCLPKGLFTMSVRLFLFTALLTCGDIESNPGPPKYPPNQPNQRQTRQTSLSFAHQDRSNPSASKVLDSPIGSTSNQQNTHEEMFDFLRNMKRELTGQTEYVRKDLACMNQKIDSITESINDLKSENVILKQTNIELKSEILTLSTKIDNLEAHSRRNNLRFNGIEGDQNEDWNVSETKIRQFISTELNIPGMSDVEIERAHRLRSGGDENCRTIIVKFSKYKDSRSVFQKAREVLKRDSKFSVNEDYTDRVKNHRRELGKEMIEARKQGHYAVIRYDKLVINNDIYRFDDCKGSIEYFGKRNRRVGNRATRDFQSRDTVNGDIQLDDSSTGETPNNDGAEDNGNRATRDFESRDTVN